MEIVTYRELRQKDDFMMLMELAFWWPLSPKSMEDWISTDARLRHGPVGFCAVEDDRLVGHAGVMDIPTMTAEGKTEIVGGVWGVATNPSRARQGISRILMEKAHEYFRSKKYRFSFLCTGRTIIAYAFYRRLGYAEVEPVNRFKGAFKVLDRAESGRRNVGPAIDPQKVYRLYQKCVQGKTGLVIRQEDFAAMHAKRKRFDEKISIFKEKGYALLTESQGVTKVQELVAFDQATYRELIDEIEQGAKSGVINHVITDPWLLGEYQSRGYRTQSGEDGVMMVKNLADVDIEDVYGNSFYLGILDWF
jgi:GNAT superfamily N-acetyltransferase